MPQRGLFPDESGSTTIATPAPSRGLFPSEAPNPLRQGLERAAETPPDQASRVFQLRLKTGLAPGVIERNLAEVEKRAAAADFDAERFRQNNPHLTRWVLEDPGHAAVVQDDLDALSALERTLSIGSNVSRAVGAGTYQLVTEAPWAGLELAGDILERLTGSPRLAGYARSVRQAAIETTTGIRGPQTGAGETERGIYSGFESLGLSVPAAAAGLVTGGASTMLGILGSSVGLQGYGRARDAGASVPRSVLYGLNDAGIEILTEQIPAHRLFGDLLKRTGFVTTLFRQVASEVPTEQAATFLQDLNEWTTLHPEAPVAQFAAERPSAAYQTLIATLVAAGGQTALVSAIDRVTGSSASQRVIQDLHAAAEASKTRERAPEALSAFVQQLTAEGLTHVYAPADTFTEYYQSKGEDPAAKAAELTGDPAAYELARATGGDLAIPTAAYVTQIVGSGHEGFFAKEVRLAPGQDNARETQARFAAQAAEAPIETEARAAQAGPDALQAEMVTRLVEGGRVDPATAETLARFISEAFPNLAARAGVDLPTLAQQWLPEVESGADPGRTPTADATIAEFNQEIDHAIAADAAARLKGLTPATNTEGSRVVPFPTIPNTLASRLFRAADLTAAATATVPIADLVATQETISEPIVRDKLEADTTAAPLVLAYRGRYYLADGTHRATAAWARGDATVDVRVATVNPEQLAALTQQEGAEFFQDARPIEDDLQASVPLPDVVPIVALEPGTDIGVAPQEIRAWAYTQLEATPSHLTPNRHTRWRVSVSTNGLKKSANYAVRAEQAVALANLDALIAAATYLRSEADRDAPTRSGVLYDYLYAPFTWRGALHVAKIGVRSGGGGQSRGDRTFYTLHAMQVTRPAGVTADYRSTATAAAPSEPGGSTLSTPDLLALVNEARETSPLFQAAGERRGRIRFREGQAPLISLFRAKNRSTFLHEAGHLFLRMQGALADELAAADPETLTDQQRKLVTDYRDVVLPHLGVTSTTEIGEPHQEQWAREFEAYVMDGKAPSLTLRAVLARAQDWLKRIYKTLQGLSREAGMAITLSPEIRAVMDRILASDEAIADAEQDAHVSALFLTPEQAQTPPAEFEGYRDLVQAASEARRTQLQTRLMRDLAREETAWWKAERKVVAAEVMAEVHQQPVYRALAAIRKGTRPDGSPLDEGDTSGVAIPMKLSKAALVAQFGEEMLSRLPRPAIYSTDGAWPADVVAEAFGFSSGQALLDAIIAAPPMAQAITERTNTLMHERHGDLLTDPAQLAALAEQAIAEEHRDTVIRAELAMLRKLQAATAPITREARATGRAGAQRLRTELPNAEALKASAEQQIASMPLRDIRPDRFFAAARRASRLATQAAAKQDFDAAVAAKQHELVNLALYRQALAMREAVDAARTTFEKMYGSDATLAKRRNMDFVVAARVIASTYFRPDNREAAAARTQKAREALAKVKQYDRDLFDLLDERISATLALGPDLQSLTGRAFVDMRDTVEALWDRSLRDHQILVKGQLLDKDLIVTELVARLDEIGPAAPPRTKFMTGLLGLRASLTRVEHWVGFVDGQNPDGVFRRYLFTPLVEALGQYRLAKADTIQRFLALLEPIRATLGPGQIAAPELGPNGYTFESRAALLHALLHSGNASNRQKLLRGRQWGELLDDGTVDDTQWRAFLQRAYRDEIITKRDMDFAQAVWDLLESLKPQAQAAHREMFGYYFNELTAEPIETPWGTYRGGYAPAILDPFESADGTARVNLDAIEGIHPSMFPPPGFTKARVEGYAQPLALDLALLPQHLDKVLRFIHVLPRAKEVNRLLTDHTLRDRLHGYDPVVVGDLLQPWAQRAYSQKVTESGTTKGGQFGDRFFRELRSRTGLNFMAGNIVNTLEQFTGLFTAATKVKPRYLRNALWRFVRNPRAMADEINEASALMATTGSGQVAEMLKTIDDLLLNPTKYQKVQDFGKQHGYFLQIVTQNIVSRVTFMGGYEQAVEAGADHDEAVRRAEAAVRETQGTGHAEDISSIEVQRPFMRVFLMFFGWTNMMANLNAYQLATVVRDMGLRKGAGRALYLYTFGFMAPVVLSQVLRQAIGGWDDDDDDSHLDEVLWLFFGSQGRMAASMVPGGAVATAAVNVWNDKPYDDRISASPAISLLESAVKAPLSVYQAIADDGPKKRAVRDVLSAVGLLTGLPTGAIARPAGYLADLADEREDPETTAELVTGLVTGRGRE